MTGIDRIRKIHGGMLTRCYNKKRRDYCRYGGSGITVCDEWRGENGCKAFVDWAINNGYKDGLSIDRIDGSKGYSPDNCRWATPSEQCLNRRNNHLIEYNGEIKPLKQWADIAGVRKDTFRRRLLHGWSIEEAINTPNLKGKARIHHRDGGQETPLRTYLRKGSGCGSESLLC